MKTVIKNKYHQQKKIIHNFILNDKLNLFGENYD